VSPLVVLFALIVGGMLSSGEGTEKGKPMPSNSPYTSDVKVHSKFIAQGFEPDGNLEKPLWKRANWVHFSHDMAGRPDRKSVCRKSV
jgi:hypothetical protein